MKKYVQLFLLTYITTSLALNPANFRMCNHKKPCDQMRGLIYYDAESLSRFERYTFRGRSWTIRPTLENTETTVTMVFKDFFITDSVYVIITNKEGTRWKQLRNDFASDFELLAPNAISVDIFVPNAEKGTFQAYYYVGCNVLTPGADEIIFPSNDQVVGLKSTCWIIKPLEVHNRRRIYLTTRDVYLVGDAKLRVIDLHSNLVIAEVSSPLSYQVYGADTFGGETLLVDLSCGSKLGTCEEFGNLFSISYYAVTSEEVACIENQKRCALDPTYETKTVCRRRCPVIERIIDEEFQRETPILKSALITSLEKGRNETTSDDKKGNEDEEEREEEAEEERDVRLGKQKPKPKPVSCRLRDKKLCKCLRTEADIKKYCFSRRSCNHYKKCKRACFYSKLFLCLRLRSQEFVNLLGR